MAELTKEEQIQAIYDLKVGYTLGHADIAMLKAMARQLLASMEQAPVYLRPFGDDGETFVACDGNDERAIPLYAAPQLPQPAVVVDRKAIADRVHGQCSRIPGATFYNAAELALDEVEACRAAMLQGAEPVRVDTLRDGWVAVPVEPTAEMQSAAASAIRFDTTPINKLWTGNAVYKAMLAAAPQQEADNG